MWSLIYGDVGEVAAGSWSELKEIASSPAGGDFEYRHVFMDKPDVYRAFFVKKFTGTEAYNRPFWSHSLPETSFLSSLWREAVPFNLSGEYGLAIAHYGDYCWLSRPDGVWRAKLTADSIDLTADVTGVKEELEPTGGKLTVKLRNDDGRYALPGTGGLSVLDIGCQLELSPGYRTSSGNECSAGQTFVLESYEHVNSDGKRNLVLHAVDGWHQISAWRARCQFRWNKDSDEMRVKDILAFVLARVGLKLEVKSESAVITGYYPDFTINPGNCGDAVIARLLSFVPDVLFIEGNKAYIVNPLATDSSVYSYGGEHIILQGRYGKSALEMNRVQVEGYDAAAGMPVIVDSFSWEDVNRLYDRFIRIEDRNLSSASEAQQRGEAYLRKAEIGSIGGFIQISVNCGQQLYDVIDVTDSYAGLDEEKRRVLGITLVYQQKHGEYEQKLLLGAP